MRRSPLRNEWYTAADLFNTTIRELDQPRSFVKRFSTIVLQRVLAFSVAFSKASDDEKVTVVVVSEQAAKMYQTSEHFAITLDRLAMSSPSLRVSSAGHVKPATTTSRSTPFVLWK